MAIFQRIRGIVHNLLRRKSVERDLDAEVCSYAELLAEENMREGMNPQEARRNARLDLGGHEQVKEAVRASRAGAWLAAALQDLRYAVRVLRKNPGFTAVAALTLALGIGANTAVFSVVDAVVLRPLPYKDSSRMVDVTTRTAMFPGFRLGISWQAFEMIRSQASAFEEFVALLLEQRKAHQSGRARATGSLPRLQRILRGIRSAAAIGRLTPATRSAAWPRSSRRAQRCPLAHALRFGRRDCWARRLFSTPSLMWSLASREKNFVFPPAPSFGCPYRFLRRSSKAGPDFNLKFVGKLRKGETLAHAQTQLETIAARVRDSQPALHDGYELSGVPLIETYVDDLRKAYLLLLGAATLVLLISCSNLASLLLARGWSRQREMALRAALGASRGRILRQVLVESLVLACVGGAAGILLAAGDWIFSALSPPRIRRAWTKSLSARPFSGLRSWRPLSPD